MTENPSPMAAVFMLVIVYLWMFALVYQLVTTLL